MTINIYNEPAANESLMEAMSYTPDHKERTRKRILTSARRLFNTHGFDGVSIDAIMADATLTRGGFYAHFRSKEALFEASLLDIIPSANPETRSPETSAPATQQAHRNMLKQFQHYLSVDHRDNLAKGCPIAAHLSDAARANPDLQAAFTRLTKKLTELWAAKLNADSPGAESSDPRLALFSMMIGGLALSRAVDDPALSNQILTDCRKALGTLAPELEETKGA